MADQNLDAPRTFTGDPHPPAKPPEVKVATAPAQNSDEGGAGSVDTSTQQSTVEQSKPATTVYRIASDESGGQSVYSMDDKLETKKLGAVSISDANDVLHAVGQFNPGSQTWTVPEDAAIKLMGGRLPLPAYLEAKWAGGESAAVRGLIGKQWLDGKISPEDARARGNAELLKSQLNEAPVFAWQGGFGPTVAKMWEDLKAAGPSGVARRVAGGVAETVPDLLNMGADAAQAAMTMSMAGAAAGAAATGGPGALPGFWAGLSVGGTYGVFKHVFDQSSGNTALEMLDKGFDPATVKTMAPLAGALNGVLMVGQVQYMTASLQRTFVKNVLMSDTVKGALARYVTEVSAGTTLAVSQKAVDIAVNNISAAIEGGINDPRMEQKPVSELVNAVVSAGPVMAVLGLPGAAKEVMSARANTVAETKAAGEMKARLTERDAALKAEEVKPVAPAAPAELKPGEKPAEPVKVVDSKGDYFSEPTPVEKAVHESLDKLEKAPENPKAVEAVNSSVERALEELNNGPREPKTFGEKVSETESKAATRQLESDLADTRTLIKELTQSRDRFERNGQSTRLLDNKLSDLLDKEQEIKNGITFYEAAGKTAGVTPNEKLLMKPATLESIAKLGVVEGRKEVLDVRRQKILDVADKLDLTQADMRSLLKDKNYGTMSDAEFNNWLSKGATKDGEHVPSFTERAAALKKRKVALEDLRAVKKDRAIVHEQYVRQLNELPPVAKMTTEQIHGYAEILSKYDKGDVALTPARVKALETTELRGAKTAGDVRKLTGIPEEVFKTVKVQERDLFTPDPQLARKDPFRGYTVSRVKEFQVRGELASQEVLDGLHALAAKAQSERRAQMGIGARVMDWLVPQQKELLAYIEAAKGEAYAGQTSLPDLTPSERAYAHAWIEFSGKALGYLEQVENLQSRFKDGNYFPHVHRGLLEMVKDIASSDSFVKEFKASVKELYDRLETPPGMPSDEIAKAIGMRKAFDYTEFRTGDLKPSNNVFAVADHYVKMFYNKVALDEAVPFINTVVKAFAVNEKTPEGEAIFKAITRFTDTYLEAKKGDARWMWAKGGRVESAIRFGQSLVAMKHIAVNLALQAMSPIGEGTGEFMALGTRGVARARLRRFSENGAAILEKYHSFIGEGVVESLHPGTDVGDVSKAVMFGAFKAIRKEVMKDILLGSMTPEEFKAQTISAERLAAIKLEAGRWIDVHGNKSIRGSSVMGGQWTQFKGWVIPPTLSIAEDVGALVSRIKGDKNALKPEHVRDFYHLAQMGVAAAMFRSWATAEMEDDSFVGRAIHYARGEVLSMFSGPSSMLGMLAGGVLMTEVAKFGNNLMMLAQLEKYKAGEKEGEIKGFDALVKQFTPAAVKQFQRKEK